MRIAATPWTLAVALLTLSCGGSSPSTPSSPSPPPAPTASFTVSPGGEVIIGVTVVTFTASAPASGGSLTYSWNFGDGTSGTGPVVNHIFNTDISYKFFLSFRKVKTTSSTGNAVIARILSGFWFDPINPKSYVFEFAQNGGVLTAEGVVGTVTNPRNVAFHTLTTDYFFTGTVEKGLAHGSAGQGVPQPHRSVVGTGGEQQPPVRGGAEGD